ncbi:MAG: GNAT family N-acetyltransferase [Oscillospiraceae bacterium]|nr:GNAT family N-acetyltransferase [Oscillospiraceae bacterium]
MRDASRLLSSLESGRFSLRPWRESDRAALISLVGDSETKNMSGLPCLRNEAEAAEFIVKTLVPRGSLALMLPGFSEPKGNLSVFESVYSRAFSSFSGLELGFSLARPHWGRGIMSEVLKLSLEGLFFEGGLDFVCCGRFFDNARCASMIKRLGFIDCFEFKSSFIRSDGSTPRELMALCTPLLFRRALESSSR